ncbi:Uncharacterised protein [uncultured archaeon]|nr:Uncharacterised protein [uncultured archaeon]
MAWYDDKNKLSYVAIYKNDKDAAKEADKAAKKGWMPQGTTATDGHINLGRTVTGAVLTGGLSLLIGGSRSKGKVTISYVRTPEWLEKNKKQTAVSQPSAPIASPKDDPMQKLESLKRMLDEGLITQKEYDAKKADLLSKM